MLSENHNGLNMYAE